MAAKKKGTRKNYTPEQKQQALDALKGGKTVKEVSQEMKISMPTLFLWKGGKGAKKGSKTKRGSDSELSLLRLENEYLKKRLAYYEK